MVVRVVSNDKSPNKIKFVCSYGGKILPRKSDGELRYVGGLTRILAVDSSISYADLMVKLTEFCGSTVTLKCPLPNGDLETLISIKSDEELQTIIKEYESSCSSRPVKIRAVLSPPQSMKAVSPASSTAASSLDSISPHHCYKNPRYSTGDWCSDRRSFSPPVGSPVGYLNWNVSCCAHNRGHRHPSDMRCGYYRNYWQ